MKAVQIMMDEDLLAALDSHPEVLSGGRSAAIRAAVEAWLQVRRQASVDAAYRRGYATAADLGAEWTGWDEEGEWPGE